MPGGMILPGQASMGKARISVSRGGSYMLSGSLGGLSFR